MKKVKLNFDQPPVPSATPNPNDPNVFIDNSGEELRQLQKEMLQRRMQRQNQEDPDGIQMNLKPAIPEQSQIEAEKYMKIKKLLGIV